MSNNQPSREQLEQYQFQNALGSTGNDQDQQKDSSALLIEGIEQTKQQIKKSLLGYHYEYVKTDQGIQRQKVNHHDKRKLCNEKAVGDFMATIDGSVNINTLGSNLSGKNISDLGEDATIAIVQLIYENREEYDIESPAVASQIVSIISTNLMAALRKAKDGRFLRHDEETREVRTIETRTNKDDKKLGFL